MIVDLLCVNYNTKDLLKRFVDALNSDWEPEVWNLVITDNDSKDGSRQALLKMLADTEADKHHIDKVITGPNVGYAQAINYAASRTQGDIICAANADVWFTTNHVKQVLKSFEDHPEQAILGVKQMDENRMIRHGGIFWDGKTNPIHRGWSQRDPLDAKFKDRVQCWTVSGSIYYIRRSVWESLTNDPEYKALFPDALGAFLPTPHFFEETFCSVFAQHRGYQVWYDGTIETAGHTWHASSDVGEASRKYFETSRGIYIQACDSLGINHECK